MSLPADDNRPPRLAWSLYKRALLGCLAIMVCAASAVAAIGFHEIDEDCKAFDCANGGDLFAPAGAKGNKAADDIFDDVPDSGAQTILLLGSDQRYIDKVQGNPSRSDTMILVRLDPEKGATTVMNIPRDLRVDIPGHGRDKINAAYALGGPKLTIKTIKALLAPGAEDGRFPISHAVNINFGGFQRAVDRLGCIFVDVDRKYYHSNAGLPPSAQYAEIDVKAGYQKLCGEDALGYVRYRHTDNDLVRAARQQDFLRQAKDQIGLGELFSNRKDLLKIFGRYTQTDISGKQAILKLIKLVLNSAKKPIQQVHFDADPAGNDLMITPDNLRRDVTAFLNAEGSSENSRGEVRKSQSDKKREKKQKKKAAKQSVPAGLLDSGRTAEDIGVPFAVKLPFPVYYPRYAALGSVYAPSDARAYDIFDRGKNKHRAYRIVVSAPGSGQFYGIQGTNWTSPPLLDNPSETRDVDGRKLQLYYDGKRLRLVAWRTDHAVYWVSNTLLLSLTNKQMLGIARSLRRVGT